MKKRNGKIVQHSISENGINLLKSLEGCRLYAYDDTTDKKVCTGDICKGTLTIGYGHTGKDVKPGMMITEEKAVELLKSDLKRTEKTVNDLVKVDLTQNQYDAICSFVFNIGSGNFKTSTFLKLLNRGLYGHAAEAFKNWHRGNGIPHVLDSRRTKEKELFERT